MHADQFAVAKACVEAFVPALQSCDCGCGDGIGHLDCLPDEYHGCCERDVGCRTEIVGRIVTKYREYYVTEIVQSANDLEPWLVADSLRHTKPERYNDDEFVLRGHLQLPNQLDWQDEYCNLSCDVAAGDDPPSEFLTRTCVIVQSKVPRKILKGATMSSDYRNGDDALCCNERSYQVLQSSMGSYKCRAQ